MGTEVYKRERRLIIFFTLPDIQEFNLHLLPVLEHEEEVQKIINDGIKAFDTNINGPTIYCATYEVYNYILVGDAKKSLMEFFEQEFFPSLKVNKR